jgi:hypothetical protein
MIPNTGIELFTLRERQSAAGEVFFTGRLGNALIVLARDEVEPDVWKAFACDPNHATDRHDRALGARAIAPQTIDEECWPADDSMDDTVPEDVMALPSQLERR